MIHGVRPLSWLQGLVREHLSKQHDWDFSQNKAFPLMQEVGKCFGVTAGSTRAAVTYKQFIT